MRGIPTTEAVPVQKRQVQICVEFESRMKVLPAEVSYGRLSRAYTPHARRLAVPSHQALGRRYTSGNITSAAVGLCPIDCDGLRNTKAQREGTVFSAHCMSALGKESSGQLNHIRVQQRFPGESSASTPAKSHGIQAKDADKPGIVMTTTKIMENSQAVDKQQQDLTSNNSYGISDQNDSHAHGLSVAQAGKLWPSSSLLAELEVRDIRSCHPPQPSAVFTNWKPSPTRHLLNIP